MPHQQYRPVSPFGTVPKQCRNPRWRTGLKPLRTDPGLFRRVCYRGLGKHSCRCSLDTKDISSDAETPGTSVLSVTSREGASTDLSVIWSRLIKVRSRCTLYNLYCHLQLLVVMQSLCVPPTAWNAVLERSCGGGSCAMAAGRSCCSHSGHNRCQVRPLHAIIPTSLPHLLLTHLCIITEDVQCVDTACCSISWAEISSTPCLRRMQSASPRC